MSEACIVQWKETYTAPTRIHLYTCTCIYPLIHVQSRYGRRDEEVSLINEVFRYSLFTAFLALWRRIAGRRWLAVKYKTWNIKSEVNDRESIIDAVYRQTNLNISLAAGAQAGEGSRLLTKRPPGFVDVFQLWLANGEDVSNSAAILSETWEQRRS